MGVKVGVGVTVGVEVDAGARVSTARKVAVAWGAGGGLTHAAALSNMMTSHDHFAIFTPRTCLVN